MGNVPRVKIIEAANGLLVGVALASQVAQADIRSAAADLARRYGEASSREVEAEIARHLRNRG